MWLPLVITAMMASGDTIIVATGTYTGAIVNKQVSIVGDAGGGSVIGTGVPYKDGSSLTTAFRLDAGAAGAEIRNFTVNNNQGASFYFAIFSRAVDGVIADGLDINDTVQGITNWGGSGWTITNNTIVDMVAAGGGGIGILVGAMPPSYRTCSDNLVQYNTIDATATATSYSCPGITVCLDTRYGAYDHLDFTEDVSGNRILDNTVIGNGGAYSAGIEMGVIGLGGDSAKIAATMGLIHDNYVMGNTIDDMDYGLYFYVAEELTATCNEVKNSATHGISIWDDFTGAIHFNSIHDNAYGLYSDVSSRTIDAETNWWGDASGPYHATLNPTGTGNAVSDNVDFDPWLGAAPVPTENVAPVTGGTASFATSVGNIANLTALAVPPGAPAGITFPHGMFSFQICCLTPGETVTLTVTLPSKVPIGTRWWKYQAGSWYSLPIGDDDGDNVITVTLQDGGAGDEDSVPGQITDDGGPGWGLGVGWETQSVNKLAVMTPWLALLAAILAGAGLLVWRRRRVEI
jgi:hypothetical protein